IGNSNQSSKTSTNRRDKGMSEEDRDLDALKQKRLAEMQKNISYKKKQEDLKSSLEEKEKNNPHPQNKVEKHGGYGGIEVLEREEFRGHDIPVALQLYRVVMVCSFL